MIIATLVNVMNTFIFHDDNDDNDELAKAWVSSELSLVGVDTECEFQNVSRTLTLKTDSRGHWYLIFVSRYRSTNQEKSDAEFCIFVYHLKEKYP